VNGTYQMAVLEQSVRRWRGTLPPQPLAGPLDAGRDRNDRVLHREPAVVPQQWNAVMVILTCRLAVLDIVAFDWLDV